MMSSFCLASHEHISDVNAAEVFVLDLLVISRTCSSEAVKPGVGPSFQGLCGWVVQASISVRWRCRTWTWVFLEEQGKSVLNALSGLGVWNLLWVTVLTTLIPYVGWSRRKCPDSSKTRLLYLASQPWQYPSPQIFFPNSNNGGQHLLHLLELRSNVQDS